ncbi:retrovirus-related Pol polyprotein from transposon RE1 [Trichonephila clavipes]|nr:retrovirus-related Pol polyprotein from transposon RE1 [Trichonephila clavipes]
MNSVASTLNRVTDMEFNYQISVLTQNNWNTWKHDMQVILMHYGCWQFIIQTKPEQPDEEATYKEKLDLQLLSKTSTETPSTSEKPDVSSDNHSLIPCTEVKWIRNIGRKVTGSNVYYSIEGEATRLKSFNEIERYCKRHNIEYDPSLFNFRKDNTESQGFLDLSEQQEALMVEVTIPNCYKQAIRSRDASKWHDAMDKEINLMMERKVWDLVDHPEI